jgi:hypothetical protein
MKMRARKPFRYAGRMLRAGDVFDTRGNQDARLLTAIGKAERVDADADAEARSAATTMTGKRRGRPPKVREPEALAPPEPAQEPEVEAIRGRYYGRRDMEAEGNE